MIKNETSQLLIKKIKKRDNLISNQGANHNLSGEGDNLRQLKKKYQNFICRTNIVLA